MKTLTIDNIRIEIDCENENQASRELLDILNLSNKKVQDFLLNKDNIEYLKLLDDVIYVTEPVITADEVANGKK